MRKALIALLVVGAAACSAPQATQPATTPPAPPAAMHEDAKKAMEGRVFPQTPVFGLTEPVNLSETLHQFGGGPDVNGPLRANQWGKYLEPLGKLHNELKEFPPLIEVVAVETVDEVVSCNPDIVRPMGLRKPSVCRENDPKPNSTPQDYLMVVHVKLVDKVNEVTVQSGAQAGWLAATMVTAVVYAQFLQQLYGVPIGWPSGWATEYCVAGMSTRAVYPADALSEQAVTDAMAATDNLLDVNPGTRDSRSHFFMQGFTGGELVDCMQKVSSVPTSASMV